MKYKTEQLSGKKSQIAVFFILGILVVVFVAYLLTQNIIFQTGQNPDIRPVKLYLDNCLELSSKKAFSEMGLMGGKRTLEEPYYSGEVAETNYLYDKGEMRIDTFEDFKRNLELEIGQNLEECFMNFSEPGMSFEKPTPNVDVEFLPEFTRVNADWPIEVTKDKATTQLGKLESTVLNVRLKLIYEVATNITEKIRDSPGRLEFIPLLETGMNITIDINPEVQLFLIIDPKSKIEQKPYGFLFAARIT